LPILFFTACQKEISTEKLSEELESANNKADKITICHYDAVTGTYKTISVNLNAWPAHLTHGDVRLDDQDGDGYVPNNACGFGQMGDCNDNAAINPGAAEICNNGTDDNCNGQIDENCIDASVTICDQVWMVKNLDVSTYRYGTPIPQVTDPTEWAGLTTGAWCYYNNDPANGDIYGKYYNWYAVNDPRGLAPVGWHVPSDAEWTSLSNCLGGYEIAGGKIKSTGTLEAGTGLWLSPNTGATNSNGFTGLPFGIRTGGGADDFSGFNRAAYWWSSTGFSITRAWSRMVTFDQSILDWGIGVASGEPPFLKPHGMSVRCLRD
jgi:uncharacterized protein (TIGR02145 family)